MSLSHASFRKIAAATAIICDELGGRVGRLDLMKILYASDRESLRVHERTITGDTYFSLKQGPVLSATLDLAKNNGATGMQKEWDAAFKNEGVEVVLCQGVKVDTEALSDFSEDLIRQKTRELTGLKKAIGPNQFIRKLHHEWTEWKNPGSSRLALPLRDILMEGLKLPAKEANRIAAQESYAKSVAEESDFAGKSIICPQ